ncbi:MAG: hypothetical protein V8R63_11715 [Thomasclavelia ramosa]
MIPYENSRKPKWLNSLEFYRLAMLIGVMSNGTIINAVDGNADANITFNSRIVEKVNGQDVDVSLADSGDSFFLQFIMLF